MGATINYKQEYTMGNYKSTPRVRWAEYRDQSGEGAALAALLHNPDWVQRVQIQGDEVAVCLKGNACGVPDLIIKLAK